MAMYSPFHDYLDLSSLLQNVNNAKNGLNVDLSPGSDIGCEAIRELTSCSDALDNGQDFNMTHYEDQGTSDFLNRDFSPDLSNGYVHPVWSNGSDLSEELSKFEGRPLSDPSGHDDGIRNISSTVLPSNYTDYNMSDTYEKWFQLQQRDSNCNLMSADSVSSDLMDIEGVRSGFSEYNVPIHNNGLGHARKISSAGSSCHNDDAISNISSDTSTDNRLPTLAEEYMPITGQGTPSFPESSRSRYMSATGEIACALCKRNGETKEFYTTHVLKDNRGKVICPVLRKYTCPRCNATGDNAHTLRHCPVNQQVSFNDEVPQTFMTRRSSCGRRRQLSW